MVRDHVDIAYLERILRASGASGGTAGGSCAAGISSRSVAGIASIGAGSAGRGSGLAGYFNFVPYVGREVVGTSSKRVHLAGLILRQGVIARRPAQTSANRIVGAAGGCGACAFGCCGALAASVARVRGGVRRTRATLTGAPHCAGGARVTLAACATRRCVLRNR